jgi:glycosyltransferase involved in cell wall biosynthesis
MNVTLYAPPEPARPTGGFRYNRRLAEWLSSEGRFRYLHSREGAQRIREKYGRGTVVLDSLFLADRSVEAEFRSAGFSVGWIVHALGSQISDGPDASPTEEERQSLSHAAFAIVPSEFMRGHLLRWFNEMAVLAALPGSGDEDPPSHVRSRERVRRLFTDAGKSRRGPVVLTAGPLSAVKNQAFLLEAIAETADARLLVVGSDDVEPAYTEFFWNRSTAIGIDDRVVHIPPVASDELAALMNGCDVYVQPSRFESYGMAVAEAARIGVPVIVPKVGGLPEAVDGAAGALCAGWDPGEWVSAIDSLRNMRRPVAASSRTWEDTAREVHGFLEAVCAAG